jgi:hypothetical protein
MGQDAAGNRDGASGMGLKFCRNSAEQGYWLTGVSKMSAFKRSAAYLNIS